MGDLESNDTSIRNNLEKKLIKTKRKLIIFCCWWSRSGLRGSQLESDRNAQRQGQQGQLEGGPEPSTEEEILRKHLLHQRPRNSRNLREFRRSRTRRSGRNGFGIGSDRSERSDVAVGFSKVGKEVGRHDGPLDRQSRRWKVDAVAFSTVSSLNDLSNSNNNKVSVTMIKVLRKTNTSL